MWTDAAADNLEKGKLFRQKTEEATTERDNITKQIESTAKRTAHSAEQSRALQSWTEQNRAEPSRVGQIRAEESLALQGSAEQSRV